MQIMDGKEVAASLRKQIASEVEALVAAGNRPPHLAAVLVGNDGASQTYVGHKEKCCGEVGFRSTVLRLPEETTEEALLAEIARLNADPQVDGFIVQLPLPKHISEQRVIEAIDPKKDVDGFHPVNTGRMISGLPSYLPATPDGILELLKYYGIETAGRHCVVIGRSNIVGRPIANLLSQKGWDCTVTLCHSRTKDLKKVVRGGDIVIAALGKAEFVTADMVKDGAVVVDVGITRVPSDKTKSGWKLLGDVKFDEVAPKCSYITPVPGGVGPMTIISLITSLARCLRNSNSLPATSRKSLLISENSVSPSCRYASERPSSSSIDLPPMMPSLKIRAFVSFGILNFDLIANSTTTLFERCGS